MTLVMSVCSLYIIYNHYYRQDDFSCVYMQFIYFRNLCYDILVDSYYIYIVGSYFI